MFKSQEQKRSRSISNSHLHSTYVITVWGHCDAMGWDLGEIISVSLVWCYNLRSLWGLYGVTVMSLWSQIVAWVVREKGWYFEMLICFFAMRPFNSLGNKLRYFLSRNCFARTHPIFHLIQHTSRGGKQWLVCGIIASNATFFSLAKSMPVKEIWTSWLSKITTWFWLLYHLLWMIWFG